MKNHAPTTVAGALALGMLLAGCSGSPATPETEQTTASAAPTSDSGSNDGADAGSTASDGAVDELRDGTWQVGDAGEVEFTADGGSLSLTEVRPADGWQHRVADEKPSELEVHFTQGDQEWKFEVESENGTVQISKELTVRNASGGDFRIGSAATLTLAVDGSTLSVSNITSAPGWSTAKQDEEPDDVELSFRSDNGGTAEFEAETDGSGVKIEISQKLRGTLG